MNVKLRVLLLALLLFGLDRGTKLAVERRLELGRPHQVLGETVRLTHVRNEGVVFGLWSGGDRRLLAGTSLLVLGVLLVYFHKTPGSRRLVLLGLGVVIAGAAGNLWDRLIRGYVTDFVDVDLVFMRWPAFNVADACICIGVVLLAIDSFRDHQEGTEDQPGPPTSDP